MIIFSILIFLFLAVWNNGNAQSPAATSPICAPTSISGYSVVHCPDGWIRYGSEKCFKIYKTLKSHAEAQKICENDSSNLASIHSLAEMQFLESYTLKDTTKQQTSGEFHFWFWTGGAKKGGLWRWTDSSPFDFTQWHHEHPPAGNDGCIHLGSNFHLYKSDSTTYGKFAVGDCNGSIWFICQKYQMDSRKVVLKA